jgi:hypothetical protein
MSRNSGGLGAALTAAALVVVLGSNIVDQWRAAGDMQKAVDQQAKALEGSAKVEAQLESLAKGVQSLAAGGNGNAQAIVDVLAKNGVKINTGAK